MPKHTSPVPPTEGRHPASPEDDVDALWQRVVGRRSFLKGVGLAGAAALPGSAAAPARPTPFKNERRPTTRRQRASTSSSGAAGCGSSVGATEEVCLGMGCPSLVGIDCF